MGKCLSKNNNSSIENSPLLPESKNKNLNIKEWPDPKEIDSFPYDTEKMYTALVCKVYDGDTVTVLIRLGDNLFEENYVKTNIRIFGIDAPELRVRDPQSLELKELEELAGARVRDEVRKLILDKEVQVQLHKWDKYGGRVVGTIYLKSSKYKTLADYLLDKKYAKPYYGSKKEDWTADELKSIIG